MNKTNDNIATLTEDCHQSDCITLTVSEFEELKSTAFNEGSQSILEFLGIREEDLPDPTTIHFRGRFEVDRKLPGPRALDRKPDGLEGGGELDKPSFDCNRNARENQSEVRGEIDPHLLSALNQLFSRATFGTYWGGLLLNGSIVGNAVKWDKVDLITVPDRSSGMVYHFVTSGPFAGSFVREDDGRAVECDRFDQQGGTLKFKSPEGFEYELVRSTG